MNDDELWLEIAGRILDGKSIAWETVSEGRALDGASADALRIIADVADLHRRGEHPRCWGSLAIEEQIGRGTFGDVYRARDAILDRDVALKLVEVPASTATPAEGRLLARVRHSNVVTVHGAAIHDGRYGIWMEFIRGTTLASIVQKEGPLTIEDVTAIGIDVCRALTAVHESGLIHGDIKPQNVMREEGGRIVVMDFGTGRVVKECVQSETLAGTPLYLAPEVLAGAAPDVRSDIYSAGVLLYYLLTGAHPVQGGTLDDLRAAHVSDVRTSVRARRPGSPPAVAAVIERACAANPSDRFESAVEFEIALRLALEWRSANNRLLIASVGVTVLMAVLVVTGRKLLTASSSGTGGETNSSQTLASALYNESFALGFKDDWESALVLVDRATAANDTSGLAHTWKAWCLAKTHRSHRDVISEAKRGVELSSSAPWERLWIEASYDRFTNDPAKEVAALTELVKLRPDYYWGLSNLAESLDRVGRRTDALPFYIKAVEFRPNDTPSLGPPFFDAPFALRAATALLRSGDSDRATRYARITGEMIRNRMISRGSGWFPAAPSAWTVPVEALWRRGDVRGAAAVLEGGRNQCATLPEPARTDLAGSLVGPNLSLGRLRAASAIAALMTRPSDQHFNRAIAMFHGGNRQSLQYEMSLASGAWGAELFPYYLIAAGRYRDAEEFLKELPRLPYSDRGATQVDLGVLALATGNRAKALRALQDARPLESRPQAIYRFEYIADIYIQRGDWTRAIGTLEDSLQLRSAPFLALWWMRNELRLAELYHATKRDADALPLEHHLRELLAAADPDFPLLLRLKELESRTRRPR